jgi:predicted enzyme related to lactoylglutathione lyase
MKVQKISAITLKIQNMKREWKFYSKVPGLTLKYGGPDSTFTTFEMKDDLSNSRTYLNLEFTNELTKFNNNFGRIVIYADNVDKLYHYFKNDENITNLITIKNEPRNGEWGERYFHILDPEEYELSFAQIINQN